VSIPFSTMTVLKYSTPHSTWYHQSQRLSINDMLAAVL
jgi:hypothetical protein